jgi:hypothetical protein
MLNDSTVAQLPLEAGCASRGLCRSFSANGVRKGTPAFDLLEFIRMNDSDVHFILERFNVSRIPF